MAWTENGPVSLPPRPVAYLAAGVMLALAVTGVGLGFRASWRNGDRPALGGGAAQADDQAALARPIVEIPALQPPPAANAAAVSNAADSQADEADDSNDIASETAAAQAVQSRPSKSATNIDDILTSRTEKPQAPARPSTDEGAPGAPGGKNDVPF